MEIRVLTKDETSLGGRIWAQAFSHGEFSVSNNQEQEDATASKSYICGVFDAAGLQAVVGVNDYRIYLGDRAVIPMGGIGGVACLPAARGKGYAGDCLRYSIARMRETGHIVSTLFPFSWDYYRKFGWEWVGTARNYSAPPSCLPNSPETEFARPANESDFPTVRRLYETYATRYRGCLKRSEAGWGFLKDEPNRYTFAYLYERDGMAEGYLVIRGGKQEEVSLREFIALTGRAQRALLGLLRRHNMQTDKFSWNAPIDDTLWSQFYHWDLNTRLQPCTQGRVVDFAGAIQAWKPDADVTGTLVLSLKDPDADWNTGTWRVEFEGGEAQATRTTQDAQISLDIQAMSQAYFGAPEIDAIRHADRLTVHDEAGFKAFKALLRGPVMWMNDSF